MFRLPAARIEVVTSLAGSASPWQATDEEVGDAEFVHAVAPAATLRVVLFPSVLGSRPRERDRGHARRVAACCFPHRRGFDQLEFGGALLHQGSGGRDALDPAGGGSSSRHGDRQFRRRWLAPHRPGVGQAGQGGQPSGLRSARAGRWRHDTHRESPDRRLHRRDRLERFGWRFQPPICPSRLSGWRPRGLKDEGRARRGR